MKESDSPTRSSLLLRQNLNERRLASHFNSEDHSYFDSLASQT